MNQGGDHEKTEQFFAIPDFVEKWIDKLFFYSDSVLFLSNQISSDHRRGSG